MALGALKLVRKLHHPAAGVLPRSSPTLSRRTPSTSARIDTSGVSATTLDLPVTLSRFIKADYRRALLQVSSVCPCSGGCYVAEAGAPTICPKTRCAGKPRSGRIDDLPSCALLSCTLEQQHREVERLKFETRRKCRSRNTQRRNGLWNGKERRRYPKKGNDSYSTRSPVNTALLEVDPGRSITGPQTGASHQVTAEGRHELFEKRSHWRIVRGGRRDHVSRSVGVALSKLRLSSCARPSTGGICRRASSGRRAISTVHSREQRTHATVMIG